MLQSVKKFLDCQSEMMLSDNVAGMVDYFRFPLSIHLADEVLVYKTSADLVEGLQGLSDSYQNLGIREVRWRLSAIELMRKNRFRIWVGWDHVYPGGVQTTGASIIYYCAFAGGKLAVEMVQYTAHQPATFAGLSARGEARTA